MTTLNQEELAMIAEFESMPDPYLLGLEKLEEAINRSERDGVCSREVAQAARGEVESFRGELNIVLLETFSLHRKFRAAETVTALLTREQLRLKLNELGYPLGASYFKKICLPSVNAGPPVAEHWGKRWAKRRLYRLKEAVAWAEARFSSAPGKLAAQIPSRGA